MVADGLAGTGIPMGIVPEGTANLLSRNLDIPQDEPEAIEVALTGRTRTIDLVKLSVDGYDGEHFAVMAGMGIDAMIMDETDPELKDKIGTGAYFVAAAKALGRLPVPMRIKVDDHRVHRRRAMICVVGNVSTLAGNIVLIPGAKPDDGLLDVYVASPHRFTQWIRVFLRLITRRRQNGRTGWTSGAAGGSRSCWSGRTTTSWTATSSASCAGWWPRCSRRRCRSAYPPDAPAAQDAQVSLSPGAPIEGEPSWRGRTTGEFRPKGDARRPVERTDRSIRGGGRPCRAPCWSPAPRGSSGLT